MKQIMAFFHNHHIKITISILIFCSEHIFLDILIFVDVVEVMLI